MHTESEIFLPSASTHRAEQRRRHRPPALASFLFRTFEQTPYYGYAVFLLFTFAVYIGTLTTYEQHHQQSVPVLFYIELGLFIYALVEFCLRIYGSEACARYRGLKGKQRFFVEHYLLVDLALLLSYGAVFLSYFTGYQTNSSILFLHGLRFLQLLRFIPLDRFVGSIPLISVIIWNYRRVLLATVFLCFVLLLPTAYLLWIVERFIETNGQFFFKTYTDSLWFTINSMATVRTSSGSHTPILLSSFSSLV